MNDDDNTTVSADEIRWTLEPLAPIETVDLLGLDEAQILQYAQDLQRDHRTARELLHLALAMVARMTTQLDRARQTIANLHDLLRQQRGPV